MFSTSSTGPKFSMEYYDRLLNHLNEAIEDVEELELWYQAHLLRVIRDKVKDLRDGGSS